MKRLVFALGVGAVVAFVSLSGQAQQAPGASKLADIPIDHVSLIVRDVAKTAKAYSEVLGLPVPAITEQTGLTFPKDYKGDRKAHPKVARFQLNGVALELLQPMGGASPWKDHLDKYGEGMYHIAYRGIQDVAATTAFAVSKGGTQVVGGPGAKVTYVDMRALLGFALEFSDEPLSPAAAPAAAVAGPVQKFADNPIAYASIIVPDNEKATALFGELMGVPVPKINHAKIVYPPDFTGDREGHPTLAMFPLKGISVAYTAPIGGMTPWRASVDKFGPTMHHLGIRIKGMSEQIDYLAEKAGGKLVVGGRDLGYCWMDMSEKLHTVFELNGR